MTNEVLKDKKQSRDIVGLRLGTLAELIANYSQVICSCLLDIVS